MTDAITTTFERCNAYALRNSALSRSNPVAKANKVEPGTAGGSCPRKTIYHRTGLRVGAAGGAAPRHTNSGLSRSTISPCCLMSPQIGVQHGNTGGHHDQVTQCVDRKNFEKLTQTENGAADAMAFGKPHGNWGTYSNSAIQAASVTAAEQRVCPNEDNANPSTAYCFEPQAVVTPSARVTTAPITLAEFIGLAVFFFLASFAAVGGFAS